MGGEIYQAQIVRNFFEIITGTDRNISRISMCVIAVAKLRNEAPERLTFLLDQVRKSRQNRELSIDILDYMCDVAYALDANAVQTAFGVRQLASISQEFNAISLDTL
ncbi:MAG: hypothetical protein GXY82_05460 [Methanospirillum sp.]|nr:hypothetical protein [Methanospirillum sp.]